jgi:F-type H+-transporting ATPase subunit delta
MQTGSTQSLAAVLAAVEEALAAGAEPGALGAELFWLVTTLDAEPALRRALTEPAVPPEAKAALVNSLLQDKVSAAALDVVTAAVSRRWSRARDLSDSLEQAAVTSVVAQAERDGDASELEDELFRFDRIIAAQPALRDALSDPAADLEGKQKLITDLVHGKVSEATEQLLLQAVVGRQRTIAAVLSYYQDVAAARRKRVVATAWVASSLSEEQTERREAALGREYGSEVHLNVIVEPSVLGGVRVAIGDEVIDSTVSTRLAQASRRMVS